MNSEQQKNSEYFEIVVFTVSDYVAITLQVIALDCALEAAYQEILFKYTKISHVKGNNSLEKIIRNN